MVLKKRRVTDRRSNVRVVFESSEAMAAHFVLRGKSWEGGVESLGKTGCSVTCRGKASDIGPTQEPQTLDLRLLCPALGKEVCIGGMQLKRASERGDGTLVLFFSAPESSQKMALWNFLNEVENPQQLGFARPRIEEAEAHKIPARGHYTEAARLERIQFIRNFTQKPLERLELLDLIPDRLSSNIENLVGSVEIPVGLAGPLHFHGEATQGIVYAPLATTEGALVASVTRGATAITRSGGVAARVLRQQMIRVPLFRFSHLTGALTFVQWVQDFFEEIRQQTRKVSRYAQLVELDPFISGSAVHLRFVYETGDAAGQNMTTTCTWHACLWILEQIKALPGLDVEHFIIESNISGDKKVNGMSFIKGRGIRVVAECYLHEEDLQKVLKVTSRQVQYAFHHISQGGHGNASLGININIANLIAAIFTATGQDIACVHESSLGVLNVECVEGGLYASMLLPALIIGTIGGGTSLPDQNQYLQMLDCQGPQHVHRLAEIIAGYCLALDISTLSALASGQFATAHEKLGRNRPVQNLKPEEIQLSFLQSMFDKAPLALPQKALRVEALKSRDDGSSIITELTSRRLSKFMGLFPYRVEWADKTSSDIMLKIKPMDTEVNLMMNSVASMAHPVLAKAYRQHHEHMGFVQCHRRELAIYRQTDPRFVKHTPRCFGIYEDPSREIFALALENIADIGFMNTVNNPTVWNQAAIEAVIDGLAQLQAIWWKKEKELLAQDWIGLPLNTKTMQNLSDVWIGLGIHAAREFQEWFDQDLLALQGSLVRTLGEWWTELESMPRTLIHNDFNPRNIGLRTGDQGLTLCAYDWELATIQVPQHDLAEFLLFIISEKPTLSFVSQWVERHRLALMLSTGDSISREQWQRGFALSVRDLMINRVPLYIMAHTLHHYKFIRRVTQNGRALLELTQPWLSSAS